MGLHVGEKVDFVANDDGSWSLRPMRRPLKSLFGILPYEGPTVTIEQMNQDIGIAAAETARHPG